MTYSHSYHSQWMLPMSEAMWLVMFKSQLARCAVQHDLDTWDDGEYEACVGLFLETGKIN